MKIVSAHLYPLEVPMRKPIRMAGETLTHAQTLLVRLIDEQGREGWGEASAAPLMTGETLGSIAASTSYLVSKSMGKDVFAPDDVAALQDSVLYGNASAKACHETALMDLLAQRAGVPLHRLLAPAQADRQGTLEMLHMLASGDLDGELEEARTLRAQGIRHWKIKVGAGDAKRDVERIRAICKELAGDVVSADANTALAPEDAALIARAGVESGLSFLEQPFRVHMADDMAALHRATGLPMCADESIQDADDILRHHEAGAAQGVSLKLIKLGGTRQMFLAGQMCLARGMRVNLACKVAETTISAAATAHAGLAIGDVAWGFSMSSRYLREDVCAEPLTAQGGAVRAEQLDRAGLGYAPDMDRLRGFASADVPSREFGMR